MDIRQDINYYVYVIIFFKNVLTLHDEKNILKV